MSTRRRKLFVSMVGTFAGGVFLATCLLDLLVDVTEDFEEFFDKAGVEVDFPMAEFTACVGFFFILLIEQVVLFIKELDERPSGRNDSLNSPRASMISVASDSGLLHSPETGNTSSASGVSRRQSTLGSVSGINSSRGKTGRTGSTVDLANTISVAETEDSMEPSKVRAAILLTALSVHSVFEGLAVGLEDSSSEVFKLFSGLVVHKSVLAFSLGMSLVSSNMSMKETLFSVMGFAVASPIGIAIGIGVSQEEGLFTLGLSTVLQGLATGTFLYITFFEVLPLEFNCRRWRLQKVASLLLGFGVMCFMIIYSGD